MTVTLENIFGIQEDHPDICESTLWKTLKSPEGTKRIQLPCTSENRCRVCQYIRSKRLRAYFSGVNLLPPDAPAYFITLTIDPKAVKSQDPQTVAEYGKQRFASFRRHHLTGPEMSWARAFEFGKQNGRFHVHMLISGDHPFAECAKAPQGKGGKRKWFNSLSAAAKHTYKMLQSYGFGIYHCERMNTHPGAVNYLTKYISKAVQSEKWVKGTRLVDSSRNWPRRYAQYQNRYCYIANETVNEMPTGSDILVKQFHQLHSMLHAEAMQTDIDFQMGKFKMKDGFWNIVKDMFHYRKLIPKYALKVPKDRRRVVKRLKNQNMCLNKIERTYYVIYHRYEECWSKLWYIHHYRGSRRFLTDAAQFPEVFDSHNYDRFIAWFFSQHPKITL